ncbi:amino-acid permease BAT1 protein [Trifolium repens]|nr:amino-acid permease BAT1 protein [Trifolium repens]
MIFVWSIDEVDLMKLQGRYTVTFVICSLFKEVFYLAFKRRYGHEFGGIICLGIVVVAILFCGMSSVTANSRVDYAFSRDWGHAIVIIVA